LTQAPLRFFDWKSTHRLILSRYSEGGTILSELADSTKELEQLALLDSATNDRIEGEQYGLPGISPFELVYGIPNAHIVRAAYTHPGLGSRFSDSTRGVWYAGDCQETSVIEVCYHRARHLADIIVRDAPGERPRGDVVTYDDWLADFHAEFHVLEPAKKFSAFLQPEPVPQCYTASQVFARTLLLERRSNGIVYPSVRLAGAQCIACFRPALVYNPRRSERLEITFTASEAGYKHRVRRVDIM
jgi:RES domain